MSRAFPLWLIALALAVSLGGPLPSAAHADTTGAAVTPAAAPALGPTPEPIAIQPPDSKTIFATIDADLQTHLAKLTDFETQYKADGKQDYFQTLISHSVVPADGAATVPDKLAAGPTNQTDKLAAFWTYAALPAALPYAFRTDVYDGPEGEGYVLTAQVVIEKELWERSVNVGPERWRDSDWHVVVVDKP